MRFVSKITLLACFCLLSLSLGAQSISGGFKTGLNFSKFDGPVAQDANGDDLESYSYATGFHVGAIVNFKLTENFGFRTELLYSQKGTDYEFNGPSYLRLYSGNASRNVVLSGTRNTTINITTSHIDIPVLAFVRLGRVELAAGVNAAVMINSRGTGEVALRDVRTPLGQPKDDIIISVDANYYQDEFQISDFSNPKTVTVLNIDYLAPSVIGAYYDASDSNDGAFQRLDLGLNAQLGFYLNQGLLLSFRANYGLTDVTNQIQDIDYRNLENSQVVTRDDFDRNISLQASIGFSF
jgi:hypothetical protein